MKHLIKLAWSLSQADNQRNEAFRTERCYYNTTKDGIINLSQCNPSKIDTLLDELIYGDSVTTGFLHGCEEFTLTHSVSSYTGYRYSNKRTFNVSDVQSMTPIEMENIIKEMRRESRVQLQLIS